MTTSSYGFSLVRRNSRRSVLVGAAMRQHAMARRRSGPRVKRAGGEILDILRTGYDAANGLVEDLMPDKETLADTHYNTLMRRARENA